MSHLPSDPYRQNSIPLNTELRHAIEQFMVYEAEQRVVASGSDRWIELSFQIDDVCQEIAQRVAWSYAPLTGSKK